MRYFMSIDARNYPFPRGYVEHVEATIKERIDNRYDTSSDEMVEMFSRSYLELISMNSDISLIDFMDVFIPKEEFKKGAWTECNFPMDDKVRNFIMSPLDGE